MDFLPAPTLTVPDALTALPRIFAKTLCSDPILLWLPALRANDARTLQNTWLSAEEKSRLAAFSLPKRKDEWLAGRVCAKLAIEDYLTTHLPHRLLPRRTDLSIITTDSGRPVARLDRCHLPLPEVSISHSGDMAMAVAAVTPCGVDVQKPSPALERVSSHFCSSKERCLLASIDRHSSLAARLNLLWAAKEAARKALSCGMPGFLDLSLTVVQPACSSKTGWLLILANRRCTSAASSQVRVLTAWREDYALAICLT